MGCVCMPCGWYREERVGVRKTEGGFLEKRGVFLVGDFHGKLRFVWWCVGGGVKGGGGGVHTHLLTTRKTNLLEEKKVGKKKNAFRPKGR